MNYKRRNGVVQITVKQWDNKIILTNILTKEVIATEVFSDHIKAVAIAQAL